MIRNIFKHSIRTFYRQKGYVFINIIGLSIGIACSLIIALFVIHELSFDQFNEKEDNIYRLILDSKIGEQKLNSAYTSSPIGPTMLQEFPEVEAFTRININTETVIKYNNQSFTENEYIETDSSFFNIFSIPLLIGNKKTVLNAPYKLVISETTAKKIFGNENPIDKMLKIGNDSSLYKITGVFEDIPENSHFNANIIASFLSNRRANDNQWLANSLNTYLLLKPETNPKQVDAKIPEMIAKYVGPMIQQFMGISLEDFLSYGNKYSLYLQPLSDIHLQADIQQNTKPASDPKYLIIFSSIALLIILIAAINFMNLSIAQAAKRAKEVGLKKVSGSSRGMLIYQFLAESMLLSFFSLIIAILIIEITLPYFNNLLQTTLHLNYFGDWYTIPLLLLLSLSVGVLAGSYPAFYLSAFKPVSVLKGSMRDSMKNGKLRSVLVVLQFTISIILIIGTIIMFRQINYMLNKDLGFKKEQLVVIRRAEALGNKVKSFKEELLQIPEVLKVAISSAVPTRNNNNKGYVIEGSNEKTLMIETNWVDYDYLETYEIEISSGRFFDESFPTDKDACIINECAVKQFNLSSPLATRFMIGSNIPNVAKYMSIIGVVKDFHFRSVQTEITPYIFRFNDNIQRGYMTVKISPKATDNTIKEIENTWKNFTANDPFQYFFMDKDFARLYKEAQQNAKLSILFTVLTILIASLGLFGLTSFTVEQRTKEIGIRKAIGASIGNIFYLIFKEILILISIAACIAWPLSYFVAKNWLQNYYYRINLETSDFLLGFIITILIALISISYRIIKAAKMNSSKLLRYE